MTHRRDHRLAAAAAATAAQRERLRLRIAATRARLLPSRLKTDALVGAEKLVADTTADAVAHVRRHPVASGAALAALLAWTFRDPLLRHGPGRLKRAYDWLAGHLPFNAAPDFDAQTAENRANGDWNNQTAQPVDETADDEEQEYLPHDRPELESTPRRGA